MTGGLCTGLEGWCSDVGVGGVGGAVRRLRVIQMRALCVQRRLVCLILAITIYLIPMITFISKISKCWRVGSLPLPAGKTQGTGCNFHPLSLGWDKNHSPTTPLPGTTYDSRSTKPLWVPLTCFLWIPTGVQRAKSNPGRKRLGDNFLRHLTLDSNV